MIYDFDHIPDRLHSDSFKWRHYPPDIIPLWVADMDFVSPEPVVQAIVDRANHGVFGYPDAVYSQPNEMPELRQVIIDRMHSLYGWSLQAEDLIFLPGVVTAFDLASHAFVAPDGGVLVQPPVYPPILNAAKTTGVLFQTNELKLNTGHSYDVDWEQFASAITPQTRMFILCNPHNPVGRVFRRTELELLAEICLRHEVIICSDEIHCDLTYPGHSHIPIATIAPEVAQNTITLMAPSKTYNIAGLQCSLAIIQNPDLRRKYLEARKGLVPWVNIMGLTAALAAYLDGQEWLDQILAYLQLNRDLVYRFVSSEMSGIHMAEPEGTYLAWLDCRESLIMGNPYEFFLAQGRVALSDGATFGSSGVGFVRLNFGCSRSLLMQGLERMKTAVDSISGL